MSEDLTTPGPWRVVAGDNCLIESDAIPSSYPHRFPSDDLGPFVAFIGNRQPDMGKADAHLIAAAQDMKKALERACTLLHATSQYMKDNPEAAEYEELYDGALCDGWCLSDDCESAFSVGIAALAKARGEA